MVNSLIQQLVIPIQISGFQREVNDIVLSQKKIFHIHGLLEDESAVVLGIDDHMMFAGLRSGDLIPITRSDIDLKACPIRINKAVEMDGNAPSMSSRKR